MADKTVYKALGLSGGIFGAAPCAIDVKNDRIVRIRPLHFDAKYDPKTFNPWKITKNGKTLEPMYKALPSPFSLAYKKRVYSPNRIKYPLKRVDWNPDGERNTQNRGKSKFVRISWDEATDLIAKEIRRLHKQYGPCTILIQGDGHGECMFVNATHGSSSLLLDKMGGFTQQIRNPDSWEGWYWGSKHVWGSGLIGMMNPANNIVKDISEHTQLLLVWGGDPETTPWGFRGQYASNIVRFWSEIGIKQVYICPDLNYAAAIHANKWIPVLPNTDAALQLAIIYMWIKEGTYDKEYIKTHTIGFDKIQAYVMGEEDGEAKTPEWASKKCGVPEWTIKALARDWAKKVCTIGHYFGGGMIRGPLAHEPARLECILLGMQGLGKPGVHQAQISYQGMPRNIVSKKTGSHMGMFERLKGTKYGDRLLKPHSITPTAWGKQMIPKTMIEKAINEGKIDFYGTGGHEVPTSDQFVKYSYPIPKEKGGAQVHMIWTDTPCRITCWNCGNDVIDTVRSPKIEFVLAQHPWLENDCLYADIILPIKTIVETDDISPCVRDGESFQSLVLMKPAIPPIGEALSNYEAVCEIAKKLNMYEEVTEGRSVPDLIKDVFYGLGFGDYISYDEFEEKGYYVLPVADDWEDDVAGLYDFYKDPVKNPLPTPSGKLEFYAERIAKHFPDDKERGPYPKWIERSESHDERISSERAKLYPLLLMSNHGRWRVHAQCDDITWTREAYTGKILGFDGYKYEPCWINPNDAKARGIKDGDIVKVFNERGGVLCGARVFERVMPGVVSVDHGARADAIIPGKLDRGGAINTVTPAGLTSKNCAGQATSGFLVDIEKVTPEQMGKWMNDYPDAFNREYDPDSGLRFDAWVEGRK
ncbi:MAG: molybdopterin-dependent oxidoreductase [Deltaproteobacteria bacterium]|nr:molybdopterin-dependent oxidoreductase [Deltaproteobacteria bacterium]